MKFKNPVLRGMYPDPSMCAANGKYYMVCSTFQYFPGVPLFESDDLINWKQIGHVLTRKSQLLVDKNNTSAGIYAPNIRFHDGRFYMVVTNVSNIGNFYVYTDDIYGEWSDPILVEQDGIDPTLFFDDDGKTYFISNGNDKDGTGYIQISEIDITNGKKLSENKPLWYGTGGRYIEAPHLYKFGEYYYVLNAEGGTEYGHMVNYARSKNLMGPYEPCPANPILTNRNLGGYQLQGAGHGDILQAADGTWWFCHLAFRQIDRYMPFHHLGRETCMEPVFWKDGWFYIGTQYNPRFTTQGFGTALLEVEAPENHKFTKQDFSYTKTFENLSQKNDWCFLCNPDESKYVFNKDSIEITSSSVSIDSAEGSPSFTGVRQCEFNETTEVSVDFLKVADGAEAGISVYMDPNHHYDLYVKAENGGYAAECSVKIGPARQIIAKSGLSDAKASFKIVSAPYGYTFYLIEGDKEINFGYTDSRYLSSEVACGFTGVFTGLFVQGGDDISRAKFTNLKIHHSEED